MKYTKILGAVALFAIALPVVGCNKTDKTSSEPTSEPKPVTPIDNDSGLPTTISYLPEPGFQIHYQRTEGSYLPWGLWLWSGSAAGAEYQFNYADDYGVIAYYPLSNFPNSTSVGFIVKQLFSYAGDNVWKKDYDNDRFIDFDMLSKDDHNNYHVYIKNSDGKIYTDSGRKTQMDGVETCQFDNNKKITIVGNNKISSAAIYRNGADITSSATSASKNGGKTIEVTLNEDAIISDVYTAKITFESGVGCEKAISTRLLYNSKFDEQFNYDGELGALYTAASTTFKVWSPVSQEITLRLYNNGTPKAVDATKGDDTYVEHQMTKGEKGVFSTKVDGDLGGKYYTYVVKNASYPDGKEIVDPYAKGAGVNGLRGMIVDFSKTDPEGWSGVDYLTYDRKELTVYETHIAELTCSDTWGGTPSKAKKYQGFYEAGTTYTKGEKTVKTGFDHIKELGVNAVQIIPFFDQANDEINTEFNWGYNPLNYNVVEGCYSSDPFDGYVRIRELKSLIQAYHDAGIEIIMDVVYNHVNGLSGSNFDVLMPFYYFRYTTTGQPSNGSGCGNETASDKYMFRKFMIDSVAFWTKEYKLGGFRFDLMGIHDIETMNQVVAKAKTINPHINVWGEPWAGGTTAMPSGFVPAVQTNAKDYVGYGQFNDVMRDMMIASGMSSIGDKGWIDQMKYSISPAALLSGMQGQTGINGSKTTDPNKTVNYVTCHDNYTLHDRFVMAYGTDQQSEEIYEKMNVLANSVVFTSQGTTFMLAGEEMLRTKIVYNVDGSVKEAVDEDGKGLGRPEVSGNSYSSSYKTNEINYEWKLNHPQMFESYKKLIALKRGAEGLHGSSYNEVAAYNKNSTISTKFTWGGKEYIAYHRNGVSDSKEVDTSFAIDVTGYSLYLDTLGRTLSGNSIVLEPFETLIIYK